MANNEFRVIEPEVPGGIGDDTVLDRTTVPRTVTSLHFVFDDWLGDDLVTSYPCYLVSSQLKMDLERLNGTGYSFGEVVYTKSRAFQKRTPTLELPLFSWWKVHGIPGEDDAGIDKKQGLVVSDRILELLAKYRISHCTIRKRPYQSRSG